LIIKLQVNAKGGLSGIALKNAYKMLERIKPGAPRQATNLLLEDFAGQLQPYLNEFVKEQNIMQNLPIFLTNKANLIAEDLLTITDKRAESSPSQMAAKIYKTLRPKAKEEVAAAMPALAIVIHKFLVPTTRAWNMTAI
ncbi:MAG: hypothetical protein O2897_05270, partial [bacterium]|nr:hypothetical protein [bacterium]